MIDVSPPKRRRRTAQASPLFSRVLNRMTVSPCCPATRCGSQPVISLAQAIPEGSLTAWPQESRSFLPLNLLLPWSRLRTPAPARQKRWKMNSLKKPLNTGVQKWIAHAPDLGVSSQPLSPGVACAVARNSSDNRWLERWSQQPSPDDTDVLLRIHHVIGERAHPWLSSIWALLDRPNLMVCLRSGQTFFTGSCARMRCCFVPPSKRAHTGKVAVKEKQSTMVLWRVQFRCDNGENCESRSRWTAVIVRHCTGQSLRAAFDSENSTGRNAGSGGTPLRQRASGVSSRVADG